MSDKQASSEQLSVVSKRSAVSGQRAAGRLLTANSLLRRHQRLRAMSRLPCSVLVIALVACADAGPQRLIAGRSDTVIVNSRELVPVNLRLVDSAGVVRQAKGAVIRLVRGDVELSKDGQVKCNRSSDADISATLGNLSTSVTLLCRPIVSIRVPRVLRLAVGSPPARLDVGAVGVDGESIHMIVGTASIGDTEVATLVEGEVRAKARGVTAVEIEAGGCAIQVPIEVVESNPESDDLLPHQQYAESLSVSAGESRNWRVPPGRYEISLFDAKGAPKFLRLASHEMNCTALPRAEQQYLCIARDRASVIVHHTEPAGRGRSSRAVLLVERKGDPASDSAWRPRRAVYGCPFVHR